MSVRDVAALSPAARTMIKQTLTKPQSGRRTKEKKKLDDATQVLIGETGTTPPKGKSAPRAFGSVNGKPCKLILDGGCTSYIVSLNFLRELGITEVEKTSASVIFGDGKSRECIGIARKNLQLRVGNSQLVSISALSFDVGDKYDFIVGREGLHALNIADWSTHYLYIKSNEALHPLEVHYVKNPHREGPDTEDEQPQDEDLSEYSEEEEYLDQDDSEEGYLIMEASDEENETSKPPFGPVEDPEKRLGRLVEGIMKQDNITREDKEHLVNVINEFKDCFGSGYEHMSTTNLLKFHVDTGNHKPIYKKPYGFLSFSEKETDVNYWQSFTHLI
ncbi:hypothetical protein BD408DRAFT_401960 [Parasitella parasitica]|nr:hypothetical protein BD408DRAFT_401960 [Parasitella parasitica]